MRGKISQLERFFKYHVKNWVVCPIFIAATAIKPPELMATEIALLTSDVIDSRGGGDVGTSALGAGPVMNAVLLRLDRWSGQAAHATYF